MRLLGQKISLFFPFRGSEDPVQRVPGYVPSGRGSDEALSRYLTETAHRRLHERRLVWTQGDLRATSGLRFDQIEVLYEGDGLGLLVLSGGLERSEGTAPREHARKSSAPRRRVAQTVRRTADRPAVAELLTAVDTARLRGALYPGQERPGWTLGTRRFVTLEEALAALVPGATPVFDDLRLFCMLHAAFARAPSLETRYAVAAIDPPQLPPPPKALLQAFLQEQCYRRWERSGMVYAFTHCSGAILSTGAPPEWLGPLLRAHYLDLATWVVVTAARRHLLAQQARLGPLDRATLDAHLRDYEWERFSEQDQGRQLVRLWLAVIEQDRHDLQHAGVSVHGPGSAGRPI